MYKGRFAVVALVMILSCNWDASAMSGAGTECTDNQNAREAISCLDGALSSAQKSLDKKYTAVKKLRLMADDGLQKKLVHSQSIWKSYVAQTCDELIGQSTKDEPIGHADVLSCKLELTKERTSDLDRMFYVPLHH